MGMTQMNTRIDETVKRAGDAVFAKLGLTPSEVVRAVWEYAAVNREAPSVVRAALDLPNSDGESLEEQIRYDGDLVARMRERFGLSAPDVLEEVDYRKLREEATYERMSERGLV